MTKADQTYQLIEQRIFAIRGHRVMLDSDLAEIYGVQTKVLNQAVRRNKDRFPEDFAFQLNNKEFTNLRSQFVTSSKTRRGLKYRPYVFTEHGALMLASVLNSSQAVEMSLFVVRAFVRLRETLSHHKELASKLNKLEQKFGKHDEEIQLLFNVIKKLMEPPSASSRKRIGFRT